MAKKRKCKGCGANISHKHPNAKFHSKQCKDKYWNRANPRGLGANRDLFDEDIDEDYGHIHASGWDGHGQT